MVHLKKIIMQGFKSFAIKTEIPLENSMNVIIGPNGSGKSNIADAICFALGRAGSKSMRVERASNFIFSGNKNYKPAKEAYVELIFDNSDKIFLLDKNEVSIKRIVKENGNSIYKINGEIKTRQEVLELLAKAGIDPDGFNLVLQGEIESFVSMSNEERRKIIEEVAGISIYESRKEKSIRELEKTEEQLKETSNILREKNNYLRNLEKDRKDALEFKKLEELIKRHKATLLHKTIKEKERELSNLETEKNDNLKIISEIKNRINYLKIEISICQEKINTITKKIEEQTSGEQEVIHREIADLKAEIAGLRVKKENFEERIKQNYNRQINLKNRIEILKKEIENILKNIPDKSNKKEQKEKLENLLNELERGRRRFYLIKSEISILENKKEEKIERLSNIRKNLGSINSNIESIFNELKNARNLERAEIIKKENMAFVARAKEDLQLMEKEGIFLEKENAVLFQIINEEKKVISEIDTLDICPLCRTKISEEHKRHVKQNSSEKISRSEKKLEENEKKISIIQRKINEIKKIIEEKQIFLSVIENEISKIKAIEEKKQTIKNLSEEETKLDSQITELNKKLDEFYKEFNNLKKIEEQYEEVKLKLKELSLDEVDYDSASADKQREIERIKREISVLERDNEDSEKEKNKIEEKLEKSFSFLSIKEKKEREIYEQFNSLYNERNSISDNQKALETEINGLTHELRIFEEKNYAIKLKEAEIKAKIENLSSELYSYGKIEFVNIPFESLQTKIFDLQRRIDEIGSINMKAIEVYDQVKQACDEIQKKVEVITKEKEKIVEIIKEIDKKKIKAFMKTLDSINSLFGRNFSQLSKKGEVFLELENKEDPFSGGLEIILKIGKGKYMDVSSLSGGEKTLVALSLIFAIQEYRPYCFYLFDEIDAALDKHNSELLASLIKRYMISGQYIVITHNDALIENSPVLFGVSMQEGISRVVSQKL